MADRWVELSPEQSEQAVIVQNELIECVNGLAREGIDPRIILAGIASASADLLTNVFGNTAVVPWFEGQAHMARQLMGRGH
jgi:hypothetical protein